MLSFVDRVVLHISAGNGGRGCVSMRREKFQPLGGPNGGNGGRGGDVILQVDPGVTTLLEYHRAPHRRASSGTHGQGNSRNGADGDDLVLSVPNGAVVMTPDGQVLVDLVGAGTRYVAAQGGRGGLGNAALASRRRKAPRFALLGEPGEFRDVVLELKTVADVALVGYPNAGKSSLVAALSAAKPTIANYPFTTLVPNLGVVTAGKTIYTVADVPGLIPGASAGKGLGVEFLRHVERCSVLVHVLDCAAIEPDRDPLSDLDVIESELAAYGRLDDRPRLVALNKVDVPEARELAELATSALADRGLPVFGISAATGEGLRLLSFAMAELVTQARAAQPQPQPPRITLRPVAVDETGFSVTTVGERFVITGEKPERWVRQTDFGNDEAVDYLARRLAKLGVDKALTQAGAQPGAEVLIGTGETAVVFDWEPPLPQEEEGME